LILLQDDYEYRSDGTKKVVRPSRLSLARVSVLRGSGENEESPFIDDHIHTSEPVVDYLTDFSGIYRALMLLFLIPPRSYRES
jgi:PAB-dependent poly(A)-specific ribonuclease subunit 2